MRALLAPYHDHLRAELERHGGTVEKFIGDAVVAVFGAPVAHEDDAERAVRAALAIRDWAVEQRERLQVRVGVNTGEAVVALDARSNEGEAMVAGDVVNTASRLQTAAPLNGVLVGDQTYRATRDRIAYQAAEPVAAKGKREPVRVWQAVQARSRFGVDVPQRPRAPMVGRVHELDLLGATLARAREEHAPQLVTIVGVPGIGKSRLVGELFHHVERAPHLVRWRQGRSLPYGDGVTFWALSEIVKAEAGVLESDSPERSERKLERLVERVAANPAEAQWLSRHLRTLVGRVDELPSGIDEAFAAWRRFLQALAEERASVLVFEDLHWADDTMLDFVDQLLDRSSGVPLLVLATARPELLHRRSSWGGGKPNAITVSLSALTDDETAELIGDLLHRTVLDPATRAELVARSGGNPLYAEQYARMLVERGALDELPETVQGIIAARLDALTDDEKRLLHDAAVIGKVFWVGAIQAVDDIPRWQADELLHLLERKEFVQRTRTSSVAGETEFAFRHVLIRDVTYGQIPRAARANKHRRVAEWIESLGRPEDQAEMLAHHYLQALELAGAAGLDISSLGESARQRLRDAGDRAASLFARDAATRFYDAALSLWPEDDPERCRVMLRRANPLAVLGEGDADLLRAARDAALTSGDREVAAEAQMLIAQVAWHRGDRTGWLEATERADQLLADVPPGRTTAWYLARRAMTTFLEGDSAGAVTLATRGLELAEQRGWDELAALALDARGSASAAVDSVGALADLERAARLATEAGSLQTLSRVFNSTSVVHTEIGDLRAAARFHRQAAALSEQIGSDSERRWYQGTGSEPPFRSGDWDEAMRLSKVFLAAVEAGEPHYISGQACLVRARIRLARGDVAGGLADAERALLHARQIQQPQVLYYMLPGCTYLFAAGGRTAEAVALAHEFLQVLAGDAPLQFAAIALPVFAAACRLLRLEAQLMAAIARRPASAWLDATSAYARGEFAVAADLLHRIGSLPDEAEARVRAAEQLVAADRPTDARLQLDRALVFYRSVGASRYIEECEALLPALA